ncbi:unnamed protein product [Dracunculus medinensis]|uniref:Uncharacterized protein n=1 Tax=Dracunculus medinensis TaxID=318479 RepID=A0A3P7PV46_DRAME|nr:unnamed protein product [Dracunculus medinensis]
MHFGFLFQSNLRWRRLDDVAESLRYWLRNISLPNLMKEQLHYGIGEVFREIQRWGEKHSSLFDDEKPEFLKTSKLLKPNRREHLRLFYDCIIWKNLEFEIDDYETANNIILSKCNDWPQMQFQFACAYAILDMLKNVEMFDSIRLKAFSRKLSNHCLYDFWITILRDSAEWEKMFASDAIVPKQKLSLAFQFAITNGYFELLYFIWKRVTETQKEYIGILQWRQVCFLAKHRDVMKFLCNNLCKINVSSLAGTTWNIFYSSLHQSIENSVNERKKIDNIRKMKFLLENCCPLLRSALLSMENFKAITDAFAHNQSEIFALFLEYLNPEQLSTAREYIDRIYDRNGTQERHEFRQWLIRRQNTID